MSLPLALYVHIPFCAVRCHYCDFNTYAGLDRLFAPGVPRFLARPAAEKDPSHKQLIPYVLMVHQDRILRYKRGRGGEENRLHGLYSIGIGGHISDQDADLFSQDALGYYDGMWREVEEEVAQLLADGLLDVTGHLAPEVGRIAQFDPLRRDQRRRQRQAIAQAAAQQRHAGGRDEMAEGAGEGWQRLLQQAAAGSTFTPASEVFSPR